MTEASFTEGTVDDDDDVVVPDVWDVVPFSTSSSTPDFVSFFSLLLTKAGFVGFGSVTEPLEIIIITFEMGGRSTGSA